MLLIVLTVFVYSINIGHSRYVHFEDYEVSSDEVDIQDRPVRYRRNFQQPEGPPRWTKTIINSIVYVKPKGSYLEMKCRARGNPEPIIVWYKNGAEIKQKSNPSKYKIRKWMLTVENLIISDQGNYTCKVYNIYGQIQHTYSLDVVARLPHKPIFIYPPQNVTAIVGRTAKFECRILSKAHPHIQWLKHYKINGSYADSEGKSLLQLIQSSDHNNTDPQVLLIRNVSIDDMGWYTCFVVNALGKDYRTAFLSVIEATTEDFQATGINKDTETNWWQLVAIIISTLVGLTLLLFVILKGFQICKNKLGNSIYKKTQKMELIKRRALPDVPVDNERQTERPDIEQSASHENNNHDDQEDIYTAILDKANSAINDQSDENKENIISTPITTASKLIKKCLSVNDLKIYNNSIYTPCSNVDTEVSKMVKRCQSADDVKVYDNCFDPASSVYQGLLKDSNTYQDLY